MNVIQDSINLIQSNLVNEWSTKDIYTLVIAIVGALLGIINTIKALRKDTMRVKILPSWETDFSLTQLSVNVINLSQFPITIENVGFKINRKQILYIWDIRTESKENDGYLPQEINPRNKLKIPISLRVVADSNFRNVKKVIIITADGRKFYGTSPALKQMVKLKNIPAEVQKQIDSYSKTYEPTWGHNIKY